MTSVELVLLKILQWGSTTVATSNTLTGTYAVRVTGTGLTDSSFGNDNQISQTVTGGTAKGTVVAWERESATWCSPLLPITRVTH